MSGEWYQNPENPRTQEFSKYQYYNYSNRATNEDIGDINGDGRNHIILSPAESYKNYGTPGEVHDLAWFEYPLDPESSVSWKKHAIRKNFNDASFVRLADFDIDGDLDVVNARTWNGTYIEIYLNENGQFTSSQLVISIKAPIQG